MRASPVHSFSLFDLEQIGPAGSALVLIFLAAGLGFFFLSFSSRHGRSRWPLHALMSLGIVAIGTGFIWAGFSSIEALSAVTRANVANSASQLALSLTGPFWVGLTGTLLGLLAGIRAIIGLIREPGPRF